MSVNGPSGLNRVHTVFEVQMSYLKDAKTSLNVFFPIQKRSVWRFLAHMQALAPHTRRRVQTNNCFHPEIKAAPFLWDCGESLCFPLRVFIYPSANNGHLAGEFFRESILPLSPSLNLLAELLSARRYPLERSPAENYLLSPPPPLPFFSMHPTFSPSSLRSGPRVTESIRFRFWGEEIDVSV